MKSLGYFFIFQIDESISSKIKKEESHMSDEGWEE